MHVESFHIRRRVMPPHRGALLVAEPFLDEGCFRRAVICLAEYSEKGAVGFVLNSPTRYVLSELLEGENDIPSIYNPQNEMFQRFKTKCSFLQNEAYLCKSFFLP